LPAVDGSVGGASTGTLMIVIVLVITVVGCPLLLEPPLLLVGCVDGSVGGASTGTLMT